MGREFFGDLDRVVVCHELSVSVLIDGDRLAVCSRAVRRMTDGRWHLSRVHLKMELPGSMALLGASVRSAWWNMGISGFDNDQVLDWCEGVRSFFRVEDHLDIVEVRIIRHFEFDRDNLTTIERVAVTPTERAGLDRFPIAIDDERSSTLPFDPSNEELYAAVMKAASPPPHPVPDSSTKAARARIASSSATGPFAELVNSGLVSAETAAKVLEEGLSDGGRIVGAEFGLPPHLHHFADRYGPAFWWCSGLDEKWQFEFQSVEVGEVNVDSVILDRLKSVASELGVELHYSWPLQQPEDPGRATISILNKAVEFWRDPHDAITVVLSKVDELLAQAGAKRRLYYRGASKALDNDDVGVLVDVLPVKAASVLQVMNEVHDLARPVPCFQVQAGSEHTGN